MECGPECLCHEIEPKRYHYLSNRDLESKYRTALTKLQNARDEIIYLAAGEFGKRLDIVLRDLDKAISRLQEERDAAAARRGFEVKDGVGDFTRQSAH